MVFSRNTEKRSRSSSSSANNSFVQNVTSRVTGLLPATITKWFSSPGSGNANGSVPTAEVSGSSTEDEALESPITTQPPSKRMKFSSPGPYNHFNIMTTTENCITTNIESIESCSTYNPMPSPSNRAPLRRETDLSTPLRSPAVDMHLEKSERDQTLFKSHMTAASSGPSIATKRKSLFDNDETSMINASKKACARSSNNTVNDPRQPCFKPSLLGSPFYPGQTMYGGAASSYLNQPNIKQRSLAKVNESNASDKSAMSQSARRILDLLENYSSPLIEAKRFAYPVPTRNETLNPNRTNPYACKSISYKTQPLHVPSMASILRLKQRSKLMDTTRAARQLMASQSSSADFAPYTLNIKPNRTTEVNEAEDNSKFRTKVKARVTRTNRGKNAEIDSDVVVPPNLPDAVLQIDQDKLPNFSFDNPINKKDKFFETPKKPMAMHTSTPISFPQPSASLKLKSTIPDNSGIVLFNPSKKPQQQETNSNKLFKFSSPVRISSDAANSDPIPKFTFGSPERSVDKSSKEDDKKVESKSGNFTATETKTVDKVTVVENNVNAKDWQCPDCWVSNKADCDKCVCCGGMKASKSDSKKPDKCTVCKFADSLSGTDKCVNCSKVANNIDKVEKTAKWKCDDCWVDNDENIDKCSCCGFKKPKPIAEVKSTNEKNWTCDECWISNKSDVDKCAACGSNKPGQSSVKPNSALTQTIKVADNSFKNIIQSQGDKWECPNCSVGNDKSLVKCACCECDKPGVVIQTPPTNSFQFGIGSSSSFKFGIDPKLQNSTTEVKSVFDNKLTTEETTETNNNVVSKAPTFTFGLPNKSTVTSPLPDDKSKKDQVPKVTFSFNVPKPTPETKQNDSQFSTSFKLPETTKTAVEEEEKPQEVPKVDLSAPVPSSTKLPVFGISSTFTSKPKEENPLSTSVTNPIMTAKVDEAKKEAKVPVANVSDTQIGGFKLLTEAKTNPTPIIFGASTPSASVTSAPTGISFSSPLQSATLPATTATSLFSTDPSTTANVFKKSESQTTAANLSSVAATASLFSFGSNAPTTAAQTEKRKFNFSFPSTNTTEATPMFKPNFGSTTNVLQNDTSNKFSFSASNNTNALRGGNGLAAGTGLGGNGLAGNTVPGNGIAPLAGGNTLSNNSIPAFGVPPANSMPAANAAAPSTGLFGNVQKESSAWPTNNLPNSNMFAANANNVAQKPAAFTFGSSTPFSSGSANTFGSPSQPANNVFGIASPSPSQPPQPSLFSSPASGAPSMFGASPSPALGMFGQQPASVAPAFGASAPVQNTFEQPAINPAAAPAFNFGVSQVSGVFGFGQQLPGQQQQVAPPAAGGVYNFGGGAAPQMQFTVGSAPNTVVRRVRKAVRRNPTR